MPSLISLAVVALSVSSAVVVAKSGVPDPSSDDSNKGNYNKTSCLYIPGDREYPHEAEWNALNRTVGGRLIRGVPVAAVCYGPDANATRCAELQHDWGVVNFFLDNPVAVVPPYWDNNTCDPFVTLGQSLSDCQIGNLARYAINVSDASTVAAGLKFARNKKIRLVIKNTGHDFLGGSQGLGSLALWTHNLKNISFITKYSSPGYTGPAVKIGAGVQFVELYKAAAARGLRVVGGSCPSVGANGGWRQGGGHGPLVSSYGLGADQTLEQEVVTADGRLLTVSPTKNSDLFWALNGGGAGNWAVVLSSTVKAHADGPVAGSVLFIDNTHDEKFWAAVTAWTKHLLVLNSLPRFSSEIFITKDVFALDMATWPGATQAELIEALTPFYESLRQLNITPTRNETAVQNSYVEHYNAYVGSDQIFTRNLTIGGRLIPRSFVQQETLVPNLTATIRNIVENNPDTTVYYLGYNASYARTGGVTAQTNAIFPAWRESLFLINLVTWTDPQATWADQASYLATINTWQTQLRDLTPGGGAYINEATFNDPTWKEDFFGSNYGRLSTIKKKYDPDYQFYVKPGVRADEWFEAADGRLCRVQGHH
ncbi:hypothetical protein B0H66DRAFT_357482 [Apodospora peruviana]|uniref:FAD-binding PCMH-type domain-containing protein n=1 Tax=Apodospora peruviana TaxID=516989 RepID=A0AAE0HX62_9PEZI|nr:hypothetical protein B0H66DRAFT_357482 [Apodospora peruviana]